MRTLDDVIADFSPESQARIKKMSDEMILEVGLQMIREELQLSQKTLAEAMGVRQPAVAQIEQRGNEIKVATLKRYVDAAGGKLKRAAEGPDGSHDGFRV